MRQVFHDIDNKNESECVKWKWLGIVLSFYKLKVKWMCLKIGDFINSTVSVKPVVIIKINEQSFLVAICEYEGDYKWI